MKQTGTKISAGEKARLRRLRAKYRKRTLIVGVILFILGIVAGWLVHGWYTGRHGDAAQVPAVTQAPAGIFAGATDDAGIAGTLTPVPEQASPFGGEAKPAETEAVEAPVETEAAPEANAQLPDIGGGEQPENDAQPDETEATALPDLPSDQVDETDPAGAEPPVEAAQDAVPAADDAEATAEPETEPEPEEPEIVAIVPYGESYAYSTQVNMDGTARVADADGSYETLRFTQTMKDYMRPSDFADKYATEYRLDGTEAGASFDLELHDYVGKSTIIPQNVVDISFCAGEDGSGEVRGYQLMDKEIGGNYEVAVEPNVPKTLYKRYAYSNVGEEMKYLVVTTYKNGKAQKILFELESDEPEPEPEIVYPTLQKGLRNDDVRTMQERLIELKYLDGKADGDFGKKTEDAVKAAQEAFGMEANGIADNAFQQKLYEGMDSKPIPAGTITTAQN